MVNEKTIIRGTGVSPGVASGRVKIIEELDDMNEMKEGDIMVVKKLSPSMVPAIKKAAGIITKEEGLTCQAGIVSKELEIPCIAGIKEAMKVLRDGMMITIDGKKGIVQQNLK